jgi:trk/ktr system potassium uptake protein
MRAVIVGCGRVGAGLAERLAAAGHEVTVLDIESDAFSRLPHDFSGNAVRGDGTDEDILRRAGAEGADAFFALTEGDNRNILSAQLASENLGIRRVVAKINDPVRSRAYSSMGLATVCRTDMLVDALGGYVGLPREERANGVQEPTGSHHAPTASSDNGRGGTDVIGGAIVAGSGPEAGQER